MDEKDWRILDVLAEERSITKAAARLYISQPALSYRLKHLEEEFGVQIMSRIPSGVELTPQGDFLVAYAKDMLQKYGQVREQIKNMVDKVQGALRIGSSGVFANYHLPMIFKGFLTLYPDVEILLKTGLSYQIVRMLQQQEITMGIVRGDHEWSGEQFLLSEEPVCLVSRESIDFGDLLDKPHIRYYTDTTLQKMIEEWWRKSFDTPPNTTMEVSTMDTARQMVLHGLGWSILPNIGLAGSYGLHVQPLFWPDGSPLIRKTWVLCTAAALKLRTVQAFLRYLENGQPIER